MVERAEIVECERLIARDIYKALGRSWSISLSKAQHPPLSQSRIRLSSEEIIVQKPSTVLSGICSSAAFPG